MSARRLRCPRRRRSVGRFVVMLVIAVLLGGGCGHVLGTVAAVRALQAQGVLPR